jgi:cyclic di-GMP phosphodiesterase
MRDEGWTCCAAESASRALMLLKDSTVHIVVSDINMPDRSGVWLLDRIKGQFPDTQVIMLTGNGETRTAIDKPVRDRPKLSRYRPSLFQLTY